MDKEKRKLQAIGMLESMIEDIKNDRFELEVISKLISADKEALVIACDLKELGYVYRIGTKLE